MKCSTLVTRSAQRRCTHAVWSAKLASNAMNPPAPQSPRAPELGCTRLAVCGVRSYGALTTIARTKGWLVPFSLGVDIGSTYTAAAVLRFWFRQSGSVGDRANPL